MQPRVLSQTLFVLCYFKDEPFVYVSSECCLQHFKNICIPAVQFLQTLSITDTVQFLSFIQIEMLTMEQIMRELFLIGLSLWKVYKLYWLETKQACCKQSAVVPNIHSVWSANLHSNLLLLYTYPCEKNSILAYF